MLSYDFHSAGLPAALVQKTARRLSPRLRELRRVVEARDWGDPAASLLLPSERSFSTQSRLLARKHARSTVFALVGIGGSNLGVKAVQEAVLGREWALQGASRVLYADTVDEDSLAPMLGVLRGALAKRQRVTVNVVSKGGETTETIANFALFLDALERGGGDARESVAVTTGEFSPLDRWAHARGLDTLVIPKNVQGRYSVFSNVGLFPLAWMGVDVDALLRGAERGRERGLEPNAARNPTALGASLLFLHAKKGRPIHNDFVFSKDMEGVGAWYRQLLGECINKEWNAGHSKRVNAGIFPSVSIGSTDLHSMVQAFLGGPDVSFHRFVGVARNRSPLRVPQRKEFDALVPNVQGKAVHDVMNALLDGTKAAFAKAKRPFASVTLPDKGAESIGEFLQARMTEMMLLGELLGVNPFDQPDVDAYKDEARKRLKR